MILDLFKSEPKPRTALPRCQHHSPAGRQCSQPVCSTSPHFCFTHKPDPDQLLIAELTEAAGSLSTPEEIHNFLKKVTLLRVQGRITPKESGNYTYLCQNLQRGLRDIAFHQKLRQERAEHEAEQTRSKDPFCGWSLPRPDRSDPSDHPLSSSDIPHSDSACVNSAQSSNSESPSAASSPTSESVSFPDKTEFSFVGAGQAQPLFDVVPTGPVRRSRALCGEGGTISTETLPPIKSNTIPNSPVPSTTPTKSPNPSESSTSIPSLTHPAAAPAPSYSRAYVAIEPPPPPKPLPPDFYNHFHPIDPSIPPRLQDKNKNIPHPDAAECARLNARRGFPNSRLYRKASSHFFDFWRR